MPVVSVSLNEKLIEELEKLKEELGYSGRSEIIRSSIRTFIEQKTELEDLKGNSNCLISITHEEEDLNSISQTQHDYQGLVKTQIHDHLENHECIQIYLVKGSAKKIRRFWKDLETNKKVKSVQVTVLD